MPVIVTQITAIDTSLCLTNVQQVGAIDFGSLGRKIYTSGYKNIMFIVGELTEKFCFVKALLALKQMSRHGRQSVGTRKNMKHFTKCTQGKIQGAPPAACFVSPLQVVGGLESALNCLQLCISIELMPFCSCRWM